MCEINGQSIFKWMFATPLAIIDNVKYYKEKETKAKEKLATQNTALQAPTEATQQVEKTASTLKDKEIEKRTLSSLRIPMTKTASNIGLNTGGSSAGATGLNIPM